MKGNSEKEHWEKIYQTRKDNEVSWYQERPHTSLNIIQKYDQDKDAPIIDVGGGNSNLIIELFDLFYTDLSALDIAGTALQKSKEKLRAEADKINWIESNILDFKSDRKYKIWHDRAVFHFLIKEAEKQTYIDVLKASLADDGFFVLSTFSTDGPVKCSGLEIAQYDEEALKVLFEKDFELLEAFTEDHETPSGGKQNFIYSIWKRRS